MIVNEIYERLLIKYLVFDAHGDFILLINIINWTYAKLKES